MIQPHGSQQNLLQESVQPLSGPSDFTAGATGHLRVFFEAPSLFVQHKSFALCVCVSQSKATLGIARMPLPSALLLLCSARM